MTQEFSVRRRLPGCVVLGVALLLCGLGPGRAAGAGETAVEATPRVVNGVPTPQFPTTGALLFGANPENAQTRCTGTLIGCETFLTAAHCVCVATGQLCQGAGAPNPAQYSVFLANSGLHAVDSISVHPDFRFPVADLAVVKLVQPVTGIAPTPINTVQRPAFRTEGTIAGYGRTGGFNQDYGIKRAGLVTTASCTAGISNFTSLCWRFAEPLGAPGADSNTCNGDSGGPLFVDFGGGEVVAGVTSGGNSFDCLATDRSYDADVYVFRSWVQAEAGSDLANAFCGELPRVGESGSGVEAFAGDLSLANPQAVHAFEVPDGTGTLRVTMNAIDDGIADFDLFVKQGSAPSPTDFDCAQTGRGQYGACDFSAPGAGTWYALADRFSGSGAYQLTTTTFAGLSGVLGFGLSSAVESVPPGGSFPYAVEIDNGTAESQLIWYAVFLILPDRTRLLLGPATPVSLEPGESAAPAFELPVSPSAPLGTYALLGLLLQASAGIVDFAVLTFDVL